MIKAFETSLTIETRRLTLKPLTASDFEDIYTLWSDKDSAPAFLAAVPGREDVWMRLLSNIGHWHTCGFGTWGARLRDTGAFIGTAGVFDFRRDIEPALDAPEAGWRIASSHRRQGLAQEAMSAVLEWSDAFLAAPRTVCMIKQTNAPSLALAARAGFSPYAQASYRDEQHLLLERRRPGTADPGEP